MSQLIELSIQVTPEFSDAVSACLFEAGAEGIMERDDDEGSWLVVYLREERDVVRLRAAIEDFRTRPAVPLGACGIIRTKLLGEHWQTAWLDALEPAHLTDRLVLRPTHATVRPPHEETIWYEPAPCFGTGDHPTTRLAARHMQRACEERSSAERPFDVLDVGSGTGVLCFVAARHGARRSIGIDTDPVAVSAARRNADLNALTEACLFSDTPLAVRCSLFDEATAFDVVVANIDAPTLKELSADLVGRLAPLGELLLTGLLEEQEEEVVQTFQALGTKLRFREQEGDWVLLTFTPATTRRAGQRAGPAGS